MQIIQISDLHVKKESDLQSIKTKILKLYEAIKCSLNANECIVICILGDIIDKGNASMYVRASEVLAFIKEYFREFNPHYEFIPGNHDLCKTSGLDPASKDIEYSLRAYCDFIKEFDAEYEPFLIHKEYDDIDLLLANSVHHCDPDYGLIDIEALEKIELSKPALIISHHSLLSESETDAAAIRNAYKLLEYIEEKEILAVLHGHTHGYKEMTIGNKCQVIGVGPFLKDIPNINNQVNLITVTLSGIQNVKNYFYREDFNRFDVRVVYNRKRAVYESTNIEKVYNMIVTDAKKYGPLLNMNLNLNMSYHEFNEQIERVFPDQIPTAELWQDTEKIPEHLYYNHGQYMKYDNITAMSFIINELKNKATSSRAIIPLINFTNVVQSGDGFLPSFDLVQFGFLEEEKAHLIVTLYLRALEVNHFLKINLCEIYLMCKQIAEDIRSIKKIDVNIFAFRAQYKEKFGCFKRAEIDTIDESEITLLLQSDLSYIVKVLTEKKDLSETVIENKGMVSLNRALQAINKRCPIKSIILDKSTSILETMDQLKSEREKTSNYTLIETIENRLNQQLDEITSLFKDGEIYES